MSSPEQRHAQVSKPTTYEHTPSSDAAPMKDADRALFNAQPPHDLSGLNPGTQQPWVEHPQAGQPRDVGFGTYPPVVHASEYQAPPERHSMKNGTKLAIGALALSTAIGGWIGIRQLNEAKNVAELYAALEVAAAAERAGEGSANAPNSSRLSTPGLEYDYTGDGIVDKEDYDLMSPTTYAGLDEMVRMNDNIAEIKQYLPTAWSAMESFLSEEELQFVSMPDLTTPPSEWSDQDYNNYACLAIRLATGQGYTQAQIDEGKRTLAAVIDPEDPLYEYLYEKTGTVASVLATFEALPSPMNGKELAPGTTIDGVTVTTDGGRLVLSNWYHSGRTTYNYFVNRRDSQGNVLPMLARTFELNDPALDRFVG